MGHSGMTYIFNSDAGHFINEKHAVIAGVINDYDPSLKLTWIPPADRCNDDSQPFAIEHFQEDGRRVVVRRLREDEVDERLIAWLFMNDNARNGRDLHAYLAAQDAAAEAIKMKSKLEQQEANADFMTSVLNGKNYYRHGGKVYS